MLFVKEINLLQAQNEGLKKQNAELQRENAELKTENERLKKENEILLCQLVINDGEDVTVQISESQFDKYNKYKQTLQDIKAIAEPFAKCYTHTCRNCKKYDSAHACCLKDIHCYKYNDGSKSSCKDFVLPTKQFYQQILANVITKIAKAESEG